MSSPSTVREDWLGLNSTWEEDCDCDCHDLGFTVLFLASKTFLLSSPWQLPRPPQAAVRPILPYTYTSSRSPSCSLACRSGSLALPGFPGKIEPFAHFHLSQPDTRKRTVTHKQGLVSVSTTQNCYLPETCSVIVWKLVWMRVMQVSMCALSRPWETAVWAWITHTLKTCNIRTSTLPECKLNKPAGY